MRIKAEKKYNIAPMSRFMPVFKSFLNTQILELLSYGEYNQPFISVICFLKTTNLSVHRF